MFCPCCANPGTVVPSKVLSLATSATIRKNRRKAGRWEHSGSTFDRDLPISFTERAVRHQENEYREQQGHAVAVLIQM
jgi:hypothetical protein